MKTVLITILLALGTASAYTQDVKNTPENNIACAPAGNNLIACFSESIDKDNNKVVELDEWQNAAPDKKGIVNVNNLYNMEYVLEESINRYKPPFTFDVEKEELLQDTVYDRGAVIDDEGLYEGEPSPDALDQLYPN